MKKVFAAIARYLRQTDLVMIFIAIIAGLYGLVLVNSASHFLAPSSGGMSSLVKTQIIAIVLGVISMIVISKIDYHTLASFWKILAALCVVLLLVTLAIGTGPSGSEDKSWIKFGKLSVQPAEFIKIAFIITFSKHYDMVKDDITSVKNVLLLGLHGAIPIGIIVLQKDMGMALVFAVIFISMLFASNIQMRYFAGAGIVLLAALPVVWNVVFGNTQRNRILALFDPLNEKYTDNMWQQNQAITALASGKLWGYGYMNGPKTQAASNYVLPERQNDMIFAVCGEELGFIGCIAVILILMVILIRIVITSIHSKDVMGKMMCVGIFSSFAVQIIINLGMVLRLLPVCGITLPFFSSGGSSVLSAFIAIGLILSIYMHRKDLMFAEQNDK